MDFGGIFKIIQFYERYEGENKMQIEQHWIIPQTVPYSVQRNCKQQVLRRNNRMWKMAKWDFALIMTLERNGRLKALKLITPVKGRLNFSCKRTTAANVDLTKSLLNNSLKNNHIIVDKIYYLPSLFVFFLRILVFKFISQPQKTGTKTTDNSATRQLAKIRPEWISQSKGSIGRPLGFVIDRLNTSASSYRIAPLELLITQSIL